MKSRVPEEEEGEKEKEKGSGALKEKRENALFYIALS